MTPSTIDRPIKLKDSRRKAARRVERDFAPIRAEAGSDSATFVLAGPSTQIDVPAEMVPLIVDILEQLLEGNAVTVAPIHTELTTQQAADLLNVSRPYLVKLLDEKVIPSKKVGTHRRVRLDDLMRFRDKDDAERRRAADELARQLDELGLGY
jgi:excisionase family DNA binding protein